LDSDYMNKFEFLLGTWNLDYQISKSLLSPSRSDTGLGSFRKILNDKYVLFEYSTRSGSEAKGIFGWDNKSNVYKYWWFENSGSFLTASCNFINTDYLTMNWHDSLLVQTFEKIDVDRIVMKMQNPTLHNEYELIMEVTFTRKY